MLFGFLLFIFFVILLLWILVLRGKINDLTYDLNKKNEFIKKHLFEVNLGSRRYIFPYVWGTNQSLVLYTEGVSPEIKTKFLKPEEARRRIKEVHFLNME